MKRWRASGVRCARLLRWAAGVAVVAACVVAAASQAASSASGSASGFGASFWGGSAGDDAFSAHVRAAQARACARLAATERRAPRGHYAFYTRGDAWHYSGPTGWAAGYVPGGLWSCYQMTADEWWRARAQSRQADIGAADISPSALNVGALFLPSYARGYRLTGDDRLRDTGLAAAAAMAQRYNPIVGAMLSRPRGDFNVIIDSLMKPQLLWWAVESGAPPELAEVARQHALTTARDFLRPDGSTYHIVYYDVATGAVLRKGQSSGYSAESTWARGQAWAIHGLAAAYRETGDQRLLVAARRVSDWYLANVPPDMVPYWDFQAPDVPLAPRDSSAAAIAASGLIDMALNDPDAEHRARYESAARATLASLSSPAYSSLGANPALLLHGTYLWASGTTDRGLAFGDAFFLEALLRLRRLPPQAPPLAIAKARASAGRAPAAVDGDLSTSWASAGDQRLELRLARLRDVAAVRVALWRGDSRAAKLRIAVSQDGRHWRPVLRTMTSGETAGYETLGFAPYRARWIRLCCAGTTLGLLNRIREVQVYAEP